MLTGSIEGKPIGGPKKTIMSYKPSTLENIDFSVFEWLLRDADIFCTTNKGWTKVPVIWVAAERAFQVKNNKDLRDNDGALIFPMIALNRDNFTKDLSKKGVFYGNIDPVRDKKGGSITIARRIKQDKTANFANADAFRKKARLVGNAGTPGAQQINFPTPPNKKVVYETITIPMPVYIESTYTITVRTEYQQQMNEILQPFVTAPGGINYIVFKRNGHTYEGFFDSNFASNNNITELGDETRIYETSFTLRVLGYLVGADKNNEQPNIVIRENAVEVKIPNERVILGDVPDWPKGKYEP